MKVISFCIALGTTILLSVFCFQWYYANYAYERSIGSYIENAYEVNTPERMIAEVNKAVEGMKKSGLSAEKYGAVWFKKPDNKMAWQYDFLNSVVERAQAVQDWQDKMEKSDQLETLGDVYEQKMDNLREFLKENGRADWIAKDAWFIENNILFYFGPVIVMGLCVLLLAAWGWFVAIVAN